MEQRRAEILVDAMLGGLSGDLPAQHGLQSNISVIALWLGHASIDTTQIRQSTPTST